MKGGSAEGEGRGVEVRGSWVGWGEVSRSPVVFISVVFVFSSWWPSWLLVAASRETDSHMVSDERRWARSLELAIWGSAILLYIQGWGGGGHAATMGDDRLTRALSSGVHYSILVGVSVSVGFWCLNVWSNEIVVDALLIASIIMGCKKYCGGHTTNSKYGLQKR